jgi:hypothetical protein
MQSKDHDVKFDCRGTLFTGSRSNLTFYDDSALSVLLSGNHFIDMNCDAIKIDRNPRNFKHLILFLENGRKSPDVTPENGDFIVCLNDEFIFWNISLPLYDSLILINPLDRLFVQNELVESRSLKLLFRATKHKFRAK